MKINYIKFKNVFSYGNTMQHIDFNSIPVGLVQIIGKNGSGKSSIIQLLNIGIYRETSGVPIGEISNEINGNGYIEVNMSSRGHIWTIISNFSPNKMSLYKNDELIDIHDISQLVRYVRDNVVDIPYHVFSNSISLSVNDFKSFLRMSAKDSRNVRDRIFGFSIINKMNDLIRAKNIELNNDLSVSTRSRDADNNRLNSMISQYVELKDKRDNELKNKLDQLNSQISETDQKLLFNKSKIAELQTMIGDYTDKLSIISNTNRAIEYDNALGQQISLNKELDAIKDSILRVESKKKMFNHRNSITSRIDHINKLINNYHNLNRLKNEVNIISTGISDLSNDIQHKDNEVANRIAVINRHTQLKNNINEINKSIADKLNNDKINHIIESMVDYINLMNDKVLSIDDDRSKLTAILKSSELKLAAMESGKCHTCGTDFDDASMIEIVKQDISGLMISISELDRIKSTIITDVNSNKKSIEMLKSQIVHVNDNINTDDLCAMQTEVDNIIIPCEIDTVELESARFRLGKMIADRNSMLIELERYKIGVDGVSGDDIDRLNNELVDLNNQLLSCDEYNEYDDDDYKKMCMTKETITKKIGVVDKMIQDISFDPLKVNLDHNLDEHGISRAIDELRIQTAKFRKNNIEMTELIKHLQASKIDVDNQINSKYFQQLEDSISDIQKSISDIDTSIRKIENKIGYNQILQALISDDGFKAYMMKDIIPGINNCINQILSKFNIKITVKFDSEFCVQLYRYGRPIHIGKISTGERKMVDYCTLIAMITVIRQKYSDINLMFFDEVFSSIDSDVRPLILESLQQLCKQTGLTVFIIGHHYMPSIYFSGSIEVVKKNNFSEIQMVTSDGQSI